MIILLLTMLIVSTLHTDIIYANNYRESGLDISNRRVVKSIEKVALRRCHQYGLYPAEHSVLHKYVRRTPYGYRIYRVNLPRCTNGRGRYYSLGARYYK